MLGELTPGRVASAVAAVLVVAWSCTLSPVRLSVLVGVAAVAIAALGLDVLVARTGQLSLAHAAFLGVGAFTALNVGGHGGAWPVALAAAVGAGALAATVAGLPSLRIRGLQIAITTLAFQIAAENFLFTRQDFTAADQTLERPPFLVSDLRLYLFALACVAVVLVVRQRLAVTQAGRSFLAVRDVEARAQCFGIEPGRTKLLAYAVSGAIVGLAGGLLAIKEGSISAKDPFVLLESLQLVAIVVVGGAGSAAGILTAAVVVKGLPQFVDRITIPFTDIGFDAVRFVPIASAALLVVAVVAQPEGIGGVYHAARRLVDRLFGRRETDRPSPRPQPAGAAAGTTRQAGALRSVPRGLSLQMPVRALLATRGVTVQYGGVTALNGVSLEVRRGEVVGLIGANGAGKSTFFNAVSGLAPVTGSIRYRGVELVNRPPARLSALGAARTFQDMGLVRAETVKENVLLAQTWLCDYGPVGGILALGSTLGRERELRRRADMALELFGLDHVAGERLGDLPYGTMRIVEIASAVAAGPDLLMLDEASAGLGPEESHTLADQFLALRDELGLTLVVIEHHVPLIARVCDYVYCLESGALIAEGAPADVTAQPAVIESFLGRARGCLGRGGHVTEAAALLRVENLCSGYGSLQVLFEVSFDVRAGEVVALMGSNGAGKTTTLRTITGQLKVLKGSVHLADAEVTGAPAERLVRQGLAMVPEGRGMLRDLSVAQNLELGAYIVTDRAAVAESLDRAYTTFPILAERREQKAGTLSGGQQQMLAVARALMSNPRLLLVDEASLGLSPVMTETVFDLLAETNRTAGVAVLLVEQNALALDLANRAFVLERGQVVDRAEGPAVRAMQGRLREAYLGGARIAQGSR